MRLIDADVMRREWLENGENEYVYNANSVLDSIDSQPTVTPWIPVTERLPDKKGQYIVAYHPCYWDSVQTDKTCVGIDNFLGKTSWAQRKFQRVTHWMPLPEPPTVPDNAEHCVVCGAVIPEGRQVCPGCAEDHHE